MLGQCFVLGVGTKRGIAGAYLVGVPKTGLHVPLPDVLRLTKTPHIPFGWGEGVVQVGVSMVCAISVPVVTGRIGPENKNYG